jgi:hypothetical protein
MEVLSQNLPGGAKENHDKPQDVLTVSWLRFEQSTFQIQA